MICCSITADSVDSAIKDMHQSKRWADIAEIRLDHIRDLRLDDVGFLLSKKEMPVIITCRKKEEGGHFSGTEDERSRMLLQAAEHGADYIDVEYSSKFLDEMLLRKRDSKIIVSYHDFERTADLENIYGEMKPKGDIIKIACRANHIEDNLKIFSLLRRARSEQMKIIGFCMGEPGVISRVLCLKYGGFLTYGCIDKGREAAPGQLSCNHLKYLYRANEISENTKVFGLVGNPVSKSRGYIVHNLAFKDNNYDAVYLNFRVDDFGSFFESYKDELSGFSITMPFKQEAMEYMDEIDLDVEKTGAINTAVFKDGRWIGHNTDLGAAVRAISEKIPIAGKTAVIIGAGGAARAIAFGLAKEGAQLLIINRDERKAMKLSKEINLVFDGSCEQSGVDSVDWENVDIIINATSVGMSPKTEAMPIQEKFLKRQVVFDAIYNPMVTKLLDKAERRGCKTISGIKMFIYQAGIQSELFMDRRADFERMEERVLEFVPQ